MTDTFLSVTLRTPERSDWPDWYLDRRNGDYFVGRSETSAFSANWIKLADRYISRKHCRIYYQPGQGWMVEDLGSANGTRLRGQKLDGTIGIQRAEILQLGKIFLLLKPVTQLPEGYTAPDEDSTMLNPSLTDKANKDHETTIFAAGSKLADKTMIFSASEFTHLAKPPNNLAPKDSDKNSDGDDDATLVGEDTITPVNTASATITNDAPTSPADDETVISGFSDDATKISPTAAETETDATVIRNSPLPTVDNDATIIRSVPPSSATVDAPVAPSVDIDLFADIDLDTSAERDNKPPVSATASAQGLAGIAAELVDAGLIEAELASRLFDQCRREGKTFFRLLTQSNEVNSLASVYRLVADSLEMELIEDENQLYTIAKSDEWLDPELAEELGLLMLTDGEASETRCAIIDPYDVRLQDWLIQRFGNLPKRLLSLPTTLISVNHRLKRSSGDDSNTEIGYSIDFTEEAEENLREDLIDVDIPQMVNYFMHRASVAGASDIHVEPGEENTVVRMRINGVLYEDATLPSELHPEISSRLKIISNMDVAEKRRPQDGRIGLSIRGKPIDVRVSSFPTVYGEKIVMRLLDRSALRPSPEHLGLRSSDLRLIMDAIHSPYGLIMLCGPTGSGKTTTLYSCLGSVDKNEKNVVTVEDPVEYRLKGVHQMQVNHKINLSFASGLRTILRQDPDVIMIGECRDAETAGMAVQAALTGHVVFSTIHTNDAVGVITRLIDMGIEPFLASSSLSMAIAQRLVRTICPYCKTTISGERILELMHDDGISDEYISNLGMEIFPHMSYAHGSGCDHCRNTGYFGRRPVFEVFSMTREARELINSDHFTDEALRTLARKSGMTTLLSDGLRLVEEDVTTFPELIRVLGESSQ